MECCVQYKLPSNECGAMSMRFSVISGCLLFACAAEAAPSSWSVLARSEDPFTKGIQVKVDYSTSPRSAVRINCDSSQKGVSIWIIPGYPVSEQIKLAKPMVTTAIDGRLLPTKAGAMYVIGDNLAMVAFVFDHEETDLFLANMAKSTRQIAFQDGISAGNHLLTNEGAAEAAEALLECVNKQAR